MSREQKEQGIELRERICQYISNYINDMGYSPTVSIVAQLSRQKFNIFIMN